MPSPAPDSSDWSRWHVLDARPDHAPFLAWALRTASRSHLDRGGLEIFVGGSEADTMRFLALWPLTSSPSWAHYTNFIVAEADGAPAGALCGYFVEEVEPLFGKPAIEVAVKAGWSHDDLVAAWNRIASGRFVAIDRVPGAWVVESVAVLPAWRRQGLTSHLLETILDRGRQRGATCAEIGVLIGNDAAERAYEKAGFAVVGEARNAEYEAVFGCPGMRLLRRNL